MKAETSQVFTVFNVEQFVLLFSSVGMRWWAVPNDAQMKVSSKMIQGTTQKIYRSETIMDKKITVQEYFGHSVLYIVYTMQ